MRVKTGQGKKHQNSLGHQHRGTIFFRYFLCSHKESISLPVEAKKNFHTGFRVKPGMTGTLFLSSLSFWTSKKKVTRFSEAK